MPMSYRWMSLATADTRRRFQNNPSLIFPRKFELSQDPIGGCHWKDHPGPVTGLLERDADVQIPEALRSEDKLGPMFANVIFSALLALAVAAPFEEAHVSIVQDSNGNYKLVYHSNSISRNEQRTQDGKVVGDYTFVDDHGHHHLIRYLAAEDHGFTADGADIPVSVPEPIEVIQSRSEHLAALQRERASNPLGSFEERPVPLHEVLSKLTVPQIASLPVEAVPFEDHEVSHAKAEHLRAYAEALARLAEEYKRTGSF